MESSTTIEPQGVSYNNLDSVVLMSVSTVTGKSIYDIIGEHRDKSITLARKLCINLMFEYGYAKRQIARLVGIDVKLVRQYINEHEAGLQTKQYALKYGRAKALVEGYEQSNELNVERLNKLYHMVKELESRYNHLKELLTAN